MHFPRKALTMHEASQTSVSTVSTACSSKALSQKCASARNFDPRAVQGLSATFVQTYPHKNTGLGACLACDFTSAVLIRTLPGELNSFSLPMTSLLRTGVVYYFRYIGSTQNSQCI